MPKRPPKYWADRTKASLAAQGVTKTPRRLMGWIWLYGMKPETRRAILRGEYDFKRPNDPQKLPKPIDLRGFDHTLVRLVPDIDQLMEIQVSLPSHIFNDVLTVTKGWKDVEVDEKNRRIVRRGKKNPATNIFLDSE
jgi:hypothetical protein